MRNTPLAEASATPTHQQGPPRRALRSLPAAGWVAASVLVLFSLAAAWPGLFTRYDPYAIDPAAALLAPSWAHLFGTDESGRDVFSRVVYGARSSLAIGAGATLLGMFLAILLGLTAAFCGRAADWSVSRFLEVLFAFPGIVLALVFIALVGSGPVPMTIAVGIAAAPGYARLIRGHGLVVRASGYMEAARVLGDSLPSAVWRHALPNILSSVFVVATLGVGQAVVWASSLSYLGLGVSPPAAEWGAMLNGGRNYIAFAWWITVFPGLAIVLVAGAATVLGRVWPSRKAQ